MKGIAGFDEQPSHSTKSLNIAFQRPRTGLLLGAAEPVIVNRPKGETWVS